MTVQFLYIFPERRKGVICSVERKPVSNTRGTSSQFIQGHKALSMKFQQPNLPSSSQSSDEEFKITFWCGKFETHLFVNAPKATYERYSRAISKFITHFPQKRFTYQFLRADFEDYKNARLREGASGKTVGIELCILRGFWRWMIAMDSPGVMINPVVGVKVKLPKRGQDEGASGELNRESEVI